MENPVFWVSLAVLATAVQPILVKLGYRVNLSAAQLLIVKNILSALVVLPFVRWFRMLSRPEFVRIGRISVLILGINGFSLAALQLLPAAVVVTITSSVPVFVALCSRLLGRERLSRRFWLGIAASVTGVLLVTGIIGGAAGQGGGKAVSFLGIAACLSAVACAVTYRVNMEVLTHDFEPRLLWMWAFWINAAAVMAVLGPVTPFPQTDAAGLWLAVGVGLSAALANSAFLWSIRLVGATSISVFQLLQRPVIIAATALILGESLSLMQWLGAALVAAGIPLAQPERLRNNKGGEQAPASAQ